MVRVIGIGVGPVIGQIGGARCVPVRCERPIIDLVQGERTATEQRSRLANLIRNLRIDGQIRRTTEPSLIVSVIFAVAGKVQAETDTLTGEQMISKCKMDDLSGKTKKWRASRGITGAGCSATGHRAIAIIPVKSKR